MQHSDERSQPIFAEAEQSCHSEDNYFDGIIRFTNTSSISDVEEHVDQTSQNNFIPAKQESTKDKAPIINIPESQAIDTSHYLQQQAISNSIPHKEIDLDINLPDDYFLDEDKEDIVEQDTFVYDIEVPQDEYHITGIDVTGDNTTVQVEKPVLNHFTADEARIPTEKLVAYLSLNVYRNT